MWGAIAQPQTCPYIFLRLVRKENGYDLAKTKAKMCIQCSRESKCDCVCVCVCVCVRERERERERERIMCARDKVSHGALGCVHVIINLAFSLFFFSLGFVNSHPNLTRRRGRVVMCTWYCDLSSNYIVILDGLM